MEPIVQNIAYPCAEPSCERTATRQVYVAWGERYLTKLACDEHVAWVEAYLRQFVPPGV